MVRKLIHRAPGIGMVTALRRLAAAMLLCAIFSFSRQSLAATDTWTGSLGASDFNTAADWGGILPATGDSFTFTTANASTTTTLTDDFAAGFGIAAITYNAGAPGYTITGNSFALGAGGITNNSTNAQVINDPITMGAAPTVFVVGAGAGSVTLGGAVSDAGGGLTLDSAAQAGTLILSASDTYTGPTTVTAGTLSLTGGISGSAITTGTNESLFIESATGTINGGSLSVVTTGTATLAGINNTGSINVGAPGNGSTAQANPGILQITGGSTVTNGTITIQGESGSSTVPSTTPMLVVTGGTLSAAALTIGPVSGESGDSIAITGNSVVSFGSTTDGGAGSEGGDITIGTTVAPETGTVSLGMYLMGRDSGATNVATTTTGLIINSGSVTALSIGAGPSKAGRGADINLNGGSLTITASTAGFELGNAAGAGNDFFNMSGGTLNYAGADGLLATAPTATTAEYTGIAITGGTATLAGITLNAIGSSAGSSILSVTGGTLYLGNVGLVLNQTGATVTATFGTATIGATAPWSSSAPISLTGNTTFQSANASFSPNAISLSGALSGAGGLTATGGGTLTLSAANTYTGNTAVAAGATLDIAGSGSLNNGSYAGNIADNGTFIYGSTATQSFSGVISGTGAFTDSEPGTMTLSGVNSYNGALTITSGTLAISGAGVLGSGSYTGGIADGGAFTYGSTANQTLSGAISGVGSLTETGLGKLTLGGSNSYVGATTVSAGTLALAPGSSLGNTAITVSGGATLLAQTGAGNIQIGTTGASITLNAGSIFSMVNSSIGDVTLNAPGAGTGTVLTLGGASLTFDIGSTGATELVVNDGTVAFVSGTTDNIGFASTGSLPSSLTNIPILSAPNGVLVRSDFTSSNPLVTIGGSIYNTTLSLGGPGGDTELLVSLSRSGSPDYYFTGALGASWSTIGNFATDNTGGTAQSTLPNSNSDVFLTGDHASNFTAQTLDGAYTINSLSFTGTDSAVGNTPAANSSISLSSGTGGDALTISPGSLFGDTNGKSYAAGTGMVVQVGSAPHIILVNINLGGNQTWEIDNSGSKPLTMDGAIADGTTLDTLTKIGVGTLILNNSANSYDGGTIVSAGTLALGPEGALPPTGTLTVNGSGTFDVAGNSPTLTAFSDGGVSTGTITNSAAVAATLTLSNGVPNTFSGTITDNGANNSASSLALNVDGAGTVTLSGSNSYNGSTTVNGTLIAANNESLGNPAAVNGGLALVGGTAEFTSANPNVASLTNGSNTGGAGTFIVLGNATTGASTTLNVGAGGALLAGGESMTFGGVISDLTASNAQAIGNLNVTGGSFLALSGANTFTGVTTISGTNSEIQILNSLALQDSTLNYNHQGGTITFAGSVATATLAGLTGSQNLSLVNASGGGVALTIGHNNATSLYTGDLGDGGPTATASLIKVGTGTVTVGSTANGGGGATYSGNTTVNDGTLVIGGTSNLAGTIDVTGAAGPSNLIVTDNTVVSSSNALRVASNDPAPGAGNPAPSTLTVMGNASVTVASLEIGAGSRVPNGCFVTVSGSASLTVNGIFTLVNTIGTTNSDNVVNLNGGTLTVNSFNEAEGSAPTGQIPTINFNGGILEAGASDTAPANDFLGALAELTPSVQAGGAIIDIPSGLSDTIGATLLHGSGATDGGLTMTGSGTLTMAGGGAYLGATTVSAGTLIVSGSLSSTASVAVNNSAVLQLAIGDAITNTARVTLSNGTLQDLPGLSQSLSDLTVASGSSTLSLGATGSIIAFANSSADVWTGTLAIANWNGLTAGGGPDQVFIGTTADLSPAQLADITFVNAVSNGGFFSTAGAVQLADGEIVAAIPEPGAPASVLGGIAMLLLWRRSRNRCRARG